MNQILKALNNKTLADSIFCDLEKAFDSIIFYCQNYPIMEQVARLNLYLNLIFRIDIKEFSLLTHFLTQTQFQNGPE